MNRNYGLGGTRSSCVQCDVLPIGPAGRPAAFVRGFRRAPRFHAKMAVHVRPSWSAAATVGVMTLITRQCFAIPTSSRKRRDCKIDEEGPTGPDRTSEREADEI